MVEGPDTDPVQEVLGLPVVGKKLAHVDLGRAGRANGETGVNAVVDHPTVGRTEVPIGVDVPAVKGIPVIAVGGDAPVSGEQSQDSIRTGVGGQGSPGWGQPPELRVYWSR